MRILFSKDERIEAVCAKPGQSTRADGCGLFGVQVDPKRGRMVASNGHALAIVPLTVAPAGINEAGEDVPEDVSATAPMVLPMECIKAARKAGMKYRPAAVELNGTAKVVTDGGVIESQPVDSPESYPDIDAVLPKANREGSIIVALDVDLLRKLADALGAKDGRVTLEVPAERGKALIVWRIRPKDGSHGDTFGVMMPVA